MVQGEVKISPDAALPDTTLYNVLYSMLFTTKCTIDQLSKGLYMIC